MGALLAVGACYLDTILIVERFPSEDEKFRASKIVRRRGGNCPNTLEVLEQLLDFGEHDTVSLALCAVLPSSMSPGTQHVKSSFGPAVNLAPCIYREQYNEPASSYIFRSRTTDSRTVINYNELPEMTCTEFCAAADKLGSEMKWCHFEGRIPPVTLECMRYLRRRFPTIGVSVEIEKPGRAGLQALAAEANVVFYSKSWAAGTGYRTPEDCLRAQAALTLNASMLCCTWGHDGASALALPSMTYEHSQAYTEENKQVIDTIGAGDTFMAGMLYGIMCHGEDWTLSHRLKFANKLAGRKVAQEGFSGLGSIMKHDL